MTATGERLRSVPGGSRLDVRALALFFTLAYALSWSWAIPLAAAQQIVRRGEGWPTHCPALLWPAIAAVVVTAWTIGRPGVRDLLARMVRWRAPVRWWLWAVSPALFLGLALVAMVAAGKALPSVAQFGQYSGTPAVGLVAVLLLIFVGAVGEETGWRGYALPRLQRRFSPLTSSLILAVLSWSRPWYLSVLNWGPVGADGTRYWARRDPPYRPHARTACAVRTRPSAA
jgi:uncharacterized protein